ncbi:hypothetical protein SAMN04488500_10175 [Sporomusa malonica]|uniref:ATP synthase I chain n=2 Tax=Sporomusa malonica TaxID=112901 RepID=A0A1W1Y7H4_9FIRM|nr:hypothetical protein SAMN04488500_10175 [Sporomusa malonica]
MVILSHIGFSSLLLCGMAYNYGGITLIPGLILGIIAGVMYFFHLYYQIERLTNSPKKTAPADLRWGWMARFSLLIIILIFLGRHLDGGYSAFVVGFFTTPTILFLNASFLIGQQILEAKKNHKKTGGHKPWGMVERKSGGISW